MMADIGLPIEMIEQAGVMLPIVAVECKYKRPAKMGDRIRIVSVIDSIPTAKLVVRSEIYNQNNELLVQGSVTLGFIDAQTRRPIRCPQNFVSAIEKHINK
jgi:acyl-CoA thioester hydrolase